MSDFTPAEIEDARNNPRPGDVWRIPERDVTVARVTDNRVIIDNGVSVCFEIWDWWASTLAALVRRGA